MEKELTIAQLTFVDLYDSYTLSLSSDVIAVPCNPDGEALNTKTYEIKYSIRAGEEMIAVKCESVELSSAISGITITPSDSSESVEGTISVKVNATTKIPEDSGINISVKTKDSNEFTFNRFISFMNLKSGKDGNPGRSITSVTEHYAATQTNSQPGSSEWELSIPSKYGQDYPYLWNYSSVNYSEGSPDSTDPQIISYWGQDGGTGRGIDRIEEWYATNDNPNVEPTSGWTTTLKVPTSDERYLWNYEIIYYDDGTDEPTKKRVIGVHGEDGAAAFTFKVVTDKGSVFKDGIEEIKLSLEAYQGENKINEAVLYEWSYYDSERAQWMSLNGPEVIQGAKTDGVSACVLGDDGYYTINMNKIDYSFSIIKLKYVVTGTTNLTLRCINYAESNYDYMLISEISTNETAYKFSESYNVDSSDENKARFNFKGQSSTEPVDVIFPNVNPGTHYIYIKARKDQSNTTDGETFKFQCFGGDATDFIENISLTVKKTDPHAYSMFKCKITYNGVTYSDYETLKKDAQDIYRAETEVLADGGADTGQYTVLCTRLYKNGKEVDELKTRNVCYLRAGNYSFSSSANKQKVITSSDIDISNPTHGDYAYFILQSKAYYYYVGRKGELSDSNADFQYRHDGVGSFIDCNDAANLPADTHLYAINYGCQIILCQYTENYEWEMCDPNYEYDYENSAYENITMQHSKVFILDKTNFPSDLNLKITVRRKIIEDNTSDSSYPPFICYTRGAETTNPEFSVTSDWGVQIKQNATGEDVYVVDHNSLIYQVLKTSYVEECFSRKQDGVYIDQVVTTTDTNGESVIRKPFFVKISSEKMSFGARTYDNYNNEHLEEMVHIGNNSTNIRNSILEQSTTVNGVATFNDNVLISNPSATNRFSVRVENDGSLSLVLA